LAEDGRSKPVASRQPSVSSARPSNWLASRTLYTKPAPPTTTLHLRCSWNRTSEKTQQRSSSWPYQWKSQKLHLPHHQERRQPQGKNHRRDDTERILFSSPGWRIHKKAKYDYPSDEDEDNPRSAANHDTHKNYPSDDDEDRQARYSKSAANHDTHKNYPSDDDEDRQARYSKSAANHDTHKNYPSDEDEDRQARY